MNTDFSVSLRNKGNDLLSFNASMSEILEIMNQSNFDQTKKNILFHSPQNKEMENQLTYDYNILQSTSINGVFDCFLKKIPLNLIMFSKDENHMHLIRDLEDVLNIKTRMPLVYLSDYPSNDPVDGCQYVKESISTDDLKKIIKSKLLPFNDRLYQIYGPKKLNKILTLDDINQDFFESKPNNQPIMFVDDSLLMRKIHASYIAKKGFYVVTGVHGGQAIEMYLSDIPFRALIIDEQMDNHIELEGYKTSLWIRAYEQELGLKNIPIINHTSSIDEDIIKLYPTINCNYLHKDLPDGLYNKLIQLLTQS